MHSIAMYFATLMAGLWAGAAIYIAFAEHPSALKVGVMYATEYFKPMSKRTAPLMMLYSAIGGGTGLYVWFNEGEAGWLVGSVLLLGMFPFTAIFIVPTNLQLIKIDAETHPEEATELHARWSLMHLFRTLLGVPAFLIFAWLLNPST
jgi:hypothetical protein